MRIVIAILAAVLTFSGASAKAAELVMVEEHGCMWCARWNAEIGPIYPKTDEGRFAPLRRVDISAPVPDDLSFKSRAVFTPTFILVEDGQEIGRIEGYPGEDFFWFMLDRLLKDATGYEKSTS